MRHFRISLTTGSVSNTFYVFPVVKASSTDRSLIIIGVFHRRVDYGKETPKRNTIFVGLIDSGRIIWQTPPETDRVAKELEENLLLLAKENNW